MNQNDTMILWLNLARIVAAIVCLGSLGAAVYGAIIWNREQDEERIALAKKILVIAGSAFALSAFIFGYASYVKNKRQVANEAPVAATSIQEGQSGNRAQVATTSAEVKSCNANKAGDTCQADNSVCAVDEYCGADDCLCHAKQGMGGSCDGSASSENCQAVDGYCEDLLSCRTDKDCRCWGAPAISWMSPVASGSPVGLPGEFITIGGRYFGSSTGEVYFTGDSGTTSIQALPAKSINPDCGSGWSDREIIVAIPKGAKPGPIRVMRQDGESDITDDDRGTKIGDFKIAKDHRPSLCQVVPDDSYIDNAFLVRGDNLPLVGGSVYFSNGDNEIQSNMSSWATTSAKGIVPFVNSGERAITVEYQKGRSNGLVIGIEPDSLRPRVSNIDPATGTIGQYITISGENFGIWNASTSRVLFFDPAEGSTTTIEYSDMAKGCADRWWYDRHIVVKVPERLTIGKTYEIQIVDANGMLSPLSAQSFVVWAGTPGPGICYLDPFNSQTGFPITVYGDGFTTDRSETYFNDTLPGIASERDVWENQKFTIRVPAGESTGPFSVRVGGKESNNLPFRLGKCSSNSDCDQTEVCCEGGTYWSGTCRRDGICDQAEPGRSGYGWKFSTSLPKPENCGGYDAAEACAGDSRGNTCPNSPGQCQVSDKQPIGNGCGDDYCSYNYEACATGKCRYDQAGNRCEIVDKSCSSTGTSTLEADVACPNGFACQAGRCVSVSSVCPEGSTCGENNLCMMDQQSCDCCCRVGNGSQDCCTGLTCTPGNCGAGAPDYGLCTGCGRDFDNDGKVSTAEEVSASDDACNCVPGKTSRFCDLSDQRYPQGVCRDRALTGDKCRASVITASTTCNNLNFSPCIEGDFCDANSGCTCQPFAAPGAPCSTGQKDNYFYTNPYTDTAGQCQAGNPPCDSANGYFCDAKACTCQTGGGQAGSLCQSSGTAGCSIGVSSCAQDYGCLAGGQQTDCRCCCDPTPDKNGRIATNSYGLSCYADKAPCSGGQRGLYCGCTSDEQCDGGASTGCSIDSCCRERPVVESVVPADQSNGICRNTMISVTFSQVMNQSTFADNFLLIGDYGANSCPTGKQFLSSLDLSGRTDKMPEDDPAEFIGFFRRLVSTLFGRADAADAGGHNYCSVPGVVNGSEDAAGNKTTLYFSPSSALDPGITYYGVIKGDEDTKDSDTDGILSENGVGMNPMATVDLGSLHYANSFFWRFTTLGQNASSQGICKIGSVSISPSSYLFQTTENNSTEDDSNKSGMNFDQSRDKDKLFVAVAESTGNQPIIPVSGYAWRWDWSVDNTDVIRIMSNVGGLAANEKLVEAIGSNQDTETYVNAAAVVTEDRYSSDSTTGASYGDSAHIWVFICDNPWPPVRNGEWSPWTDRSGNCTVSGGNCQDSGFQLYYCRDAGGSGSADDLPAILSSNVVIRPSSPDQGVLKEFYFLREDLPASSTSLSVIDVGIGRTVQASWSPVSGAARYKIYYGTRSNTYSMFIATTSTSASINGLKNGTRYYFAVTSLNDRAVESTFSEEITVIPTDSTLPAAPQGVKATTSAGSLVISWEKVSGAKSYKAYYGSKSGVYGGIADVPQGTEYRPAGLVVGNIYYFVVATIDNAGHESPHSQEVSAKIPDNR